MNAMTTLIDNDVHTDDKLTCEKVSRLPPGWLGIERSHELHCSVHIECSIAAFSKVEQTHSGARAHCLHAGIQQGQHRMINQLWCVKSYTLCCSFVGLALTTGHRRNEVVQDYTVYMTIRRHVKTRGSRPSIYKHSRGSIQQMLTRYIE